MENFENEIWKDIHDYEGKFVINNLGEVKSQNRYLPMPNGGYKLVSGKTIKQYQNKNGYCVVVLGTTHSNKKRYYVHRLVAQAFPEICGEWFEGCEIDHINTIRNDNIATNLKVVTCSENANNPLTVEHQRSAKIGKKRTENFCKKQSELHKGKKLSEITKHKISKANKKAVTQILPNGTEFSSYFSATDASQDLGINRKSINNCCLGKQKTAGGYIWRYAKEGES